jgi:hypothetical protein
MHTYFAGNLGPSEHSENRKTLSVVLRLNCMCACVCARTRAHICLCVFTREREREREIKRDRESERERDREACSGGHLITEHVNFGSKHGIPRQAAIATRTHARTHAHTRTRTRTRHTHGFRCFELQVRPLGLDRRGERGGFSGAGWRPDKERSAEEEGEEEERGGERRREEEEEKQNKVACTCLV